MRFGAEYPIKPPTCTFLTRIYHMNVSNDGKIELNILKDKWRATNRIKDILENILKIIKEPNSQPENESELQKLYKTDKTKYEDIAEKWCKSFAK
jgi:ubiquitin-conjugating enzyme E2 D/E